MNQLFMTIPGELEESAFIDGASRLRILWQVILPLIVTTSPDVRTLAVGLSLSTGRYGTEWHLLMAAASP